MADEPQPAGMTGTLRENIVRLAERERRCIDDSPLSLRIADAITAFTGSMLFVALHLLVYGSWIAINLGLITLVPRFDPTFVVLACSASVEAIFLSTFVLISQNRMADANRRRAELDLHVTLLTEHELTRLADLIERIARKLEVPVDAQALGEIVRDVDPTAVMDALEAEHRRANHS